MLARLTTVVAMFAIICRCNGQSTAENTCNGEMDPDDCTTPELCFDTGSTTPAADETPSPSPSPSPNPNEDENEDENENEIKGGSGSGTKSTVMNDGVCATGKGVGYRLYVHQEHADTVYDENIPEIGEVPISSTVECWQICATNPLCQSFTHDQKNRMCRTTQTPNLVPTVFALNSLTYVYDDKCSVSTARSTSSTSTAAATTTTAPPPPPPPPPVPDEDWVAVMGSTQLREGDYVRLFDAFRFEGMGPQEFYPASIVSNLLARKPDYADKTGKLVEIDGQDCFVDFLGDGNLETLNWWHLAIPRGDSGIAVWLSHDEYVTRTHELPRVSPRVRIRAEDRHSQTYFNNMDGGEIQDVTELATISAMIGTIDETYFDRGLRRYDVQYRAEVSYGKRGYAFVGAAQIQFMQEVEDPYTKMGMVWNLTSTRNLLFPGIPVKMSEAATAESEVNERKFRGAVGEYIGEFVTGGTNPQRMVHVAFGGIGDATVVELAKLLVPTFSNISETSVNYKFNGTRWLQPTDAGQVKITSTVAINAIAIHEMMSDPNRGYTFVEEIGSVLAQSPSNCANFQVQFGKELVELGMEKLVILDENTWIKNSAPEVPKPVGANVKFLDDVVDRYPAWKVFKGVIGTITSWSQVEGARVDFGKYGSGRFHRDYHEFTASPPRAWIPVTHPSQLVVGGDVRVFNPLADGEPIRHVGSGTEVDKNLYADVTGTIESVDGRLTPEMAGVTFSLPGVQAESFWWQLAILGVAPNWNPLEDTELELVPSGTMVKIVPGANLEYDTHSPLGNAIGLFVGLTAQGEGYAAMIWFGGSTHVAANGHDLLIMENVASPYTWSTVQMKSQLIHGAPVMVSDTQTDCVPCKGKIGYFLAMTEDDDDVGVFLFGGLRPIFAAIEMPLDGVKVMNPPVSICNDHTKHHRQWRQATNINEVTPGTFVTVNKLFLKHWMTGPVPDDAERRSSVGKVVQHSDSDSVSESTSLIYTNNADAIASAILNDVYDEGGIVVVDFGELGTAVFHFTWLNVKVDSDTKWLTPAKKNVHIPVNSAVRYRDAVVDMDPAFGDYEELIGVVLNWSAEDGAFVDFGGIVGKRFVYWEYIEYVPPVGYDDDWIAVLHPASLQPEQEVRIFAGFRFETGNYSVHNLLDSHPEYTDSTGVIRGYDATRFVHVDFNGNGTADAEVEWWCIATHRLRSHGDPPLWVSLNDYVKTTTDLPRERPLARIAKAFRNSNDLLLFTAKHQAVNDAQEARKFYDTVGTIHSGEWSHDEPIGYGTFGLGSKVAITYDAGHYALAHVDSVEVMQELQDPYADEWIFAPNKKKLTPGVPVKMPSDFFNRNPNTNTSKFRGAVGMYSSDVFDADGRETDKGIVAFGGIGELVVNWYDLLVPKSALPPTTSASTDESTSTRSTTTARVTTTTTTTPAPTHTTPIIFTHDPGSCSQRCDSGYGASDCYCGINCLSNGNCCSDYAAVCPQTPVYGSCEHNCLTEFVYVDEGMTDYCYCDDKCANNGDCCDDYTAACTTIASTDESTITTTTTTTTAEPTTASTTTVFNVSQESCEGQKWLGRELGSVPRCHAGYEHNAGCQCDATCTNIGDCCDDYDDVCHPNGTTTTTTTIESAITTTTTTSTAGPTPPELLSCEQRCGIKYDAGLQCQCDEKCEQHNECCSDYIDVCAKPVFNGSTVSKPQATEPTPAPARFRRFATTDPPNDYTKRCPVQCGACQPGKAAKTTPSADSLTGEPTTAAPVTPTPTIPAPAVTTSTAKRTASADWSTAEPTTAENENEIESGNIGRLDTSTSTSTTTAEPTTASGDNGNTAASTPTPAPATTAKRTPSADSSTAELTTAAPITTPAPGTTAKPATVPPPPTTTTTTTTTSASTSTSTSTSTTTTTPLYLVVWNAAHQCAESGSVTALMRGEKTVGSKLVCDLLFPNEKPKDRSDGTASVCTERECDRCLNMTDLKCRDTGLMAEANNTHLVHTWTEFSGNPAGLFEAKAAALSSDGQPGDPHNLCGIPEDSLTPQHDIEYCGGIAAAISSTTTLTTATTTTMFTFANPSNNTEFLEAFTNCLADKPVCTQTNTATDCCPPNIEHWDVSKFTSFKRGASLVSSGGSVFPFKKNLSRWDVSRVTNFENLFSNYLGFDGDISGWKPSAATSMAYMFQRAKKFSGDINGWSMRLPIQGVFGMFYRAENFGSGGDGLSKWSLSDTSPIVAQDHMENLFNAFDGTGCNIMEPQADQQYEQPTPGTYCGMQVAAPMPATSNTTTEATFPTTTAKTTTTPATTTTTSTTTKTPATSTNTTTTTTDVATQTPTKDDVGMAIIGVEFDGTVCNNQSSSSLHIAMNEKMLNITNYLSCSVRCTPAALKLRRSLLAATGNSAAVEALYIHTTEGDDTKLASELEDVLPVGSQFNITVGTKTVTVTVTSIVVTPAPKYAKSEDTEIVEEPGFIAGMVALGVLVCAVGIGVAKKVIDNRRNGKQGKYNKLNTLIT